MRKGHPPSGVSVLCPARAYQGETEFETKMLSRYLDEATAFLESLSWCTEVRAAYFGVGVGGVIAVFLVEVVVKGVELEWLWVVAGDLPPAYVAADRAPTPCAALSAYCELLERWVEAVRQGTLGAAIFPLPLEPTTELATELSSRLATLRRIVLPALCPPEPPHEPLGSLGG
jgi:hypothetical protein